MDQCIVPVTVEERPTKKVRRVAGYAKYGLVVGSILDGGGGGGRSDCGILAHGKWPSWALILVVGRYNLKWIMGLRQELHQVVGALFPETLLLTENIVDTVLQRYPVALILCEKRAPGAGCLLWSMASLIAVVSARGLQGMSPRGWFGHSSIVSHAAVGGSTNGSWTVSVTTRSEVKPQGVFDFGDMPLGNLISCMDQSLMGRSCSPPPIRTEEPGVHAHMGHDCAMDGLYATGTSPGAEFVVPAFRMRSGYCIRALTQSEIFLVWDVTPGLTAGLRDNDRSELIRGTAPMKVLGAVLRNVGKTLNDGSGEPGLDRAKRKAIDMDRYDEKSGPPLKQEKRAESEDPWAASAIPSAFDLPGLDDGPAPCEPTSAAGGAPCEPTSAAGEASQEGGRNLKAARADDAEIPKWMWNDRLWDQLVQRGVVLAGDETARSKMDWAAEILRERVAHKWWVINLRRGFEAWRAGDSPHARDDESLVAGLDACQRAEDSTWWEWNRGSRLFFWRWPPEYLITARDGLKPRFRERPERWVTPQRVPPDPVRRALMRSKVAKVLDRGYIGPGAVTSLMNVFEVPKGEGDIRLVYDGTKSHLNACLFAPWFGLSTLESLLRSVDTRTWLGDNDIGEQFHNFILHSLLQPYCGIDLTLLFPERIPEGRTVAWERWTRAPMGVMQSPYQAAQGMIWWEESVRGNRLDPANPLRWERIVLNLPGSLQYNPSKPWVYKARVDGTMASDFRGYVDDLRATGPTEEDCWQVTRVIGSKSTYSGIQDASRKRRKVSQTPGAWAGAVVRTDDERVAVTISQERWDKTKGILAWIDAALKADWRRIPFKPLESHRGFLVYVTRTYPATVPYLKGIHLTLDSWREGRDEDGWAVMRKNDLGGRLGEDVGTEAPPAPGAPDVVKAAKRLRFDLNALMSLFAAETPAIRMARPERSASALYGFGDASGYGFGSTLAIDGRILYRTGKWTEEMAMESSNFREFCNLIDAVADHAKRGHLENVELFLFTDNTTSEAAFFKGTSKSKKLFELVLRLRNLQMHYGMHLHVIHVAGKRMMAQGTDGVSRGDMLTGVFAGKSMTDYVPLHLTALDRSPDLLTWVRAWYPRDLTVLDPVDWYDRVLNQPVTDCLWVPAPAAADAAVEQLCMATLKRTNATHIIIIPRLLTSRWRKLLTKATDVLVTLPLNGSYWGTTQHEPLLLAISFPLIRCNPWRLKGTLFMGRIERSVSEMPPSGEGGLGAVLREFCLQAWALDGMPQRVVRSMLS